METIDNTMGESTSKCPSSEQLSAFFDNASDLPATLTGHIGSCPACKQKLGEFYLLSLYLKHYLNAATPDNLIENIKLAIHKKLHGGSPTQHRFPALLFKIAAAFVIFSFVLFYSIDSVKPSTVKKPIQSTYQIKHPQLGSRYNDRMTPYYSNEHSGFMPGTITENSIPLHDIVGANYGSSNHEPVFQVNNVPDEENSTTSIAPVVHQVWVTENPGKAATILADTLKCLHIAPVNVKISAANGGFMGNVTLTKLQLVKLVRHCKQAGLDLLSPQAPQPEQNKFRGRPDSQVEYSFDIVSPNK